VGITATLDTQVVSGTTDEQGKVQFTNLQPGSWTVSEETRSGWLPADGYSDIQMIDLVSPKEPDACQQLTFANQLWREGCISVMKSDPLGSPIEGWEMTLYQEDDLPGNSADRC
jgi:hypothetical protein